MVAMVSNNDTLRLRNELRIKPGNFADGPCYVIEDPLNSRFFRIGVREYELVRRLSLGPAEALRELNTHFPHEPLTPEEADTIIRWLAGEGLLAGSATLPRQNAQPAMRRWLNPLIFKIPLVNPNQWLERHLHQLRWLVTGPVRWLWLVMVLSGLTIVLFQFDSLLRASAGVFYQSNWVSLALIWVVSKYVHEFFHALLCKHYGGSVFEAGIILILFIPVGYVDATSSWRFENKRQRVEVALAGMAIEIFLASVALWIWLLSNDAVIRDVMFNVFFIAGVTTVLFNANPLMRFDGYFALADILDRPNLYSGGRRYVHHLIARYLFGFSEADTAAADAPQSVRVYGVLAACWRVTVIIGLLIAASLLFHGAGLVLAILAGIGIAMQLRREWQPHFGACTRGEGMQAIARAMLIVVSVWLAAVLLSWPQSIRAPAIVQQAGASAVRSPADAFVREVTVDAGQIVAAGDVLLRLTSADTELELTEQRLALQQVELEMLALRQRNDVSAAKRVAEQHSALSNKVVSLQQEIASFTVTAPHDGVVADTDPAAKTGLFVNSGDVLLHVIDRTNVRISATFDEREVAALTSGLAHIRLPQRQAFDVILEQQSPRAHVYPSDVRLAANVDGPLAVEINSADASQSKRGPRLLAPRFEWSAELDPQLSAALNDGEVGVALLRGEHQSLSTRLNRVINTWIEHLIARGQANNNS